MGRYRDAFGSRKPAAKRPPCHFEPAATEEQIAAAEAALGMPIPDQLRQLYREFDGIWWGTKPPSDTEPWIVLPTRLLRPAKDKIGGLWYAGDIAGWSAEFAKCVVYTMPEHGASFWFMTDAGAWGIPPALVGMWDHDGDEWNPGWSLERFLAEWGG